MQIRLTKENLIALNSIWISTQKDVNDWIRDTLLGEANVKQMWSNQPQQNNDSLIPLLVRLVEAQESIALSAGRVWQRTLNESSEQSPEWTKTWMFKLENWNIKLIKDDKSIEEQYWRPKKPNHRTLSPAQQDWVLDLVKKTINWISSDWDWESNSGTTRNIQLVYESLKWPADLYDQYKIYMYEWLLDNQEEKAELFKF